MKLKFQYCGVLAIRRLSTRGLATPVSYGLSLLELFPSYEPSYEPDLTWTGKLFAHSTQLLLTVAAAALNQHQLATANHDVGRCHGPAASW